MRAFLKRFHEDQSAATAVEYGLICALIAVVCIPAIQAVTAAITEAFNSVANATPVD